MAFRLPCRPNSARRGCENSDRRRGVITECRATALLVGAICEYRLVPLDVAKILTAVRASWSIETCDPADRELWTAEEPSRGQCGVTALVINDLLGGDLILADVLWADGSRQGYHYWNLLPDGTEIDLTISQFQAGELVQQGHVVQRPAGPPGRCRAEYELLRARTHELLNIG